MQLEDLYYKPVKTKTNLTYSVDMLRIKTYMTYFEFKELEVFLETYYKDKIKRFWISDRKRCFRYNYQMQLSEEKSFYFGFMHNNETVCFNSNLNKLYNFTVEFNPNKLKNDELIVYILKCYGSWYLRSFDLAVDVPVSILDIIFDIGNRRKVITRSYGGDNLSYSVGEGKGRFKIYNKKKESDLSIVGNLTRIEISFEYDDFPLSDIRFLEIDDLYFPNVYLNQYVYSLSDITQKDATLNAILYAVQHGFPLKNLSRVYRNKIKHMLEGGSKVRIFKNHVKDAFNQCIFAYLICDSKQKFR